MIYAVEAVGVGRVKLGFSKNEHTFVWRYQSIDTHCPTELEILGVWGDASRAKERSLHKDWSDLHIKGEWFTLTPKLRRFIRNNFKPFKITEDVRALALLLRSKKDAELPLLLDDKTFCSLDDISTEHDEDGTALSFHEVIGTPAMQERILLAKEEAEIVAKAGERPGRRGRGSWEQIVKLRGEGFTFAQIAMRLGKSTHAVMMAFRRGQAELKEKD